MARFFERSSTPEIPRRFHVAQIDVTINVHDNSEVKQLGQVGPVMQQLSAKLSAHGSDLNDVMANLTEQCEEYFNKLAEKKEG